MRFSFFIPLLTFSLSLWALSSATRQEIEERIKPIGQVYVLKQQSANNKKTTESEIQGKRIYEQYCSVCHQNGIASAPLFRNEENWKSRLNKKTIDDLVSSATKGLNAMPAKGTCIECTDEDLKNALQYMLPQS